MRAITCNSTPKLAGWIYPQPKAPLNAWNPNNLSCPCKPDSTAASTNRRIGYRVRRKNASKAADAAPGAQTSSLAVPSDWSVVSADKQWRIRLVNKQSMDELRRIVAIQATGFYEGSPVPFMDGLFRTFFTAEVLGELQKKVKFNPSDRFAMLVAERVQDSAQAEASPRPASSVGVDTSKNGTGGGTCDNIVGVVEVSYLDEKEVLKSLPPGTQAFAYVASMAVTPAWHRRGVATFLLQAAERVAELWEEQEPVLHVFQDNQAAVQLYRRCGYEIVFQDAPWLARLGVRPRFLMQKRRQQQQQQQQQG